MMGAGNNAPRCFAGPSQGACQAMDVILHIGAHRTASTSFQFYMRENAQALVEEGVGFWGPLRTRNGVLTGVVPVPGGLRPQKQMRLAKGRIGVHCERAQANGVQELIVSDENMLGSPRQSVRDVALYRGAGERMARFAEAFDGRITRVCLSIRSYDAFWSSALAFAVGRGHKLPDAARLAEYVVQKRGWRDVITDLACAVPGAQIMVMPYEVFGGRAERKLELMVNDRIAGPMKSARVWMNRGPQLAELRRIIADRGGDPALLPLGEGRYNPFDASQVSALRESYADDLFWLTAGADGLAHLMTENGRMKDGETPRIATQERGRDDDQQEGRVA